MGSQASPDGRLLKNTRLLRCVHPSSFFNVWRDTSAGEKREAAIAASD
jgi:hypothetical protein